MAQIHRKKNEDALLLTLACGATVEAGGVGVPDVEGPAGAQVPRGAG